MVLFSSFSQSLCNLAIRKLKFIILVSSLLFFSSIDAKTHTIFFWSGETLKGTVVSIGASSIKVKKKNGTIEDIPKKQIIKLLFRDLSVAEIEKNWQDALKEKEELKIEKEEKEKEERKKFLEELRLQRIEENKKKITTLAPLEKQKNIYYYLYSPNTKNINLADATSECFLQKEIKQWYILFGSIPINEIKTDEIFSETGQYRIYTKATLMDSIMSVVLGLTTSFTRKTIFIESCKSEDIFILQKNEIDALLDKQKESTSESVIKEIEEEDNNFRENQNGKKK